MLTVFARSFMNATRTNTSQIHDTPKRDRHKRRWLPENHWWLENPRDVDLKNL